MHPQIKCRLVFPLKVVNDSVQTQTDNPEITFTNTGPVKAIAFSVDYERYLYDKSLSAIVSRSSLFSVTHGHLVFEKKLEPADSIKEQLDGFHSQNNVGIYVFTISYYRESDMKMFDRKEIFFIENDEVFSEKDYAKNNNYKAVVQAMKKPHKPLSACFYAEGVEGTNGPVWALETPKTGMTMMAGDRSGLAYTGTLPEDPRTAIKEYYAKAKRPLLYVRPVKLEETGTYVGKLEIVGADTLKANIKYEVENIGDVEAVNVSEVGGMSYDKALKTGEKIYLNIPIFLKNGSIHDRSMQDMLRDMEKQGYVINIKNEVTICYFQESVNREYRATVAYKIEKNNVSLIKIQLD